MRLAARVPAAAPTLSDSYFWRGESSLLFLRLVKDKGVFRVELVDTASGATSSPDVLNSKLSRRMVGRTMKVTYGRPPVSYQTYLPLTAALSVDGTMLLWRCTPKDAAPSWVAARMDGSSQEWPGAQGPSGDEPGPSGTPMWLARDREWLALDSYYSAGAWQIEQATIYRVGQPAPVRAVHVSGLPDGWPLGARPDGSILLVRHPRSSEPSSPVAFYRLVLDRDSATAQRQDIALPAGMRVSSGGVALSPAGDRLAWVLERGRGPSRQFYLCVSSWQGTAWRTIASAPGVWEGRQFSWPRELRWLPGGRRVSLVYRGALWTVPVD